MMVVVAPRVGSALALIGILLSLVTRPAPAPPVVERIEIHGNAHTRDKTIRRELGIAEAERAGASDLALARRRLLSLGYFLAVAVSSLPSAPGRVTIDVDVVEVPHVRSGGFSSSENFIAECTMRQN
jgi:outer membrane protein insertion porin family